jgi:hypothetical protein
MDAYVKGIGEPAPSIHPFADEVLEAIWRHSLAFPRRPAFVNLTGFIGVNCSSRSSLLTHQSE